MVLIVECRHFNDIHIFTTGTNLDYLRDIKLRNSKVISFAASTLAANECFGLVQEILYILNLHSL